MSRLDHVMIRTLDIGSSIFFYSAILDLKVASIDNRDEEGSRYDSAFLECRETGVQIELFQGRNTNENFETGALGHIAIRVKDAKKKLEIAHDLGFKTVELLSHFSKGSEYIIGKIHSPEGIEIAIIQKKESGEAK